MSNITQMPAPSFEGLPEEKKIEILRKMSEVDPEQNEKDAKALEALASAPNPEVDIKQFLASDEVHQIIEQRDQTAFLAHQQIVEAFQTGVITCFQVMSSAKAEVKTRRAALSEVERLAKAFHDYGVGFNASAQVAVPPSFAK